MEHEDARDLIQKAFILIWDKRDSIDENKSLKAYLYRIAYTRMLNFIESGLKFKDVEIHEKVNTVDLPDNQLDYSELTRHISAIVARMPEKRGLVFELCFLKQFTYKETADAMKVSVKTIENHMTRAFKELRGGLIRIYGEGIWKEFE